MIVVKAHLTKRSSPPLAVPITSFKVTSRLNGSASLEMNNHERRWGFDGNDPLWHDRLRRGKRTDAKVKTFAPVTTFLANEYAEPFNEIRLERRRRGMVRALG